MRQAKAIALVGLLLLPSIFLGGLVRRAAEATLTRDRVSEEAYSFSPTITSLIFDIKVLVIPPLLHGVIAGALSVYLASRILKRDRFLTAAYAYSTLFVVLSLISLVQFTEVPFIRQLVYSGAYCVGIVSGLFLVAQSVDKDRPATTSSGGAEAK